MVDVILGKKIGMTQVFGSNGEHIPVTVIEAGPCTVLQVKTRQKDGYQALQLGFDPKSKEKQTTKPERGHHKNAGLLGCRLIQEAPLGENDNYNVGDVIKADIFSEGEHVDVIGISKGKGFQGTMRRFGWSRGPMTHGSHSHRAPGSIGSSAWPSRVFKGHPGYGRMGGKQVTVLNLRVHSVDAKKNLLVLKGAVPGANGDYVRIRKSVKTKTKS